MERMASRVGRRPFLRSSLALAGLGLLGGCGPGIVPGRAREAPLVGFLSGNSEAAARPSTDAFLQGLRELGYVEGTSIRLEYRFADGRDERLPDLAAELVARRVSVIFAPTSPAALAAKAATAAIPIVVTSTDPVAVGLVASLARPGANVTGLSYATALVTGKGLELLKAVSPDIERVAILWYAPSAASAVQLRQAQDAAPRLGLQVRPSGVPGPDGFDAAFEAVASEQTEALFVIDGPEFFTRRTRILEFVERTRLPAMYPRREWVEGGGLIAYGVNFPDVYRRAATYIDKILKGAKPADLPIEQPTKFDFVINLKAAQALGLTIPQSVLQQATDLIQ
jgi:putative tryptophan/tyrosine transport system substrate-binding protein